LRFIQVQGLLNVICGALLLLFLFVLSPNYINSDSASGILLAQELLRAGTWLSRDWAYVSDSLALDGGVPIAVIGAHFWGASVITFVFTVSVCAALAFAACYMASRVLQASRVDAISASLLLLLGPSLIYLDLVLALTVSVQMALILCFVAALSHHVFRQDKPFALLGALLILLAITLSSPKKALAYVVLPTMASGGAMLAMAWLGSGAPKSVQRRLLVVLGATPLVMMCGYVLHGILVQDLSVNTTYAKLELELSPDRILSNIALCLDLFRRFAGGNDSLFPVLSVGVAVSALLIFFVAPGLEAGRDGPLLTPRNLFYMYAIFGMVAVSAYLLSYADVRPYYGIYYALVPFAVLLPVVASTASAIPRGRLQQVTRMALLAALLPGAANVIHRLQSPAQGRPEFSIKQRTNHQDHVAAINWLKQRGLTRGYATYWEANSITLLSGMAIQVAPVLTPTGRNVVRRKVWLTDRDRVNYIPGDEPWFILLPVKQRSAKLPPTCLPPSNQAIVRGIRIYVYQDPMPGCLQKPARFGPRRQPRARPASGSS
jgi:hypothetical protein